MIKKLLSVVLFASTVGVADTYAQSTCTPDISCVPTDSTFGICPDSAMGIAMGSVGQAYSQQMSIKIPGTTTQGGFTLPLTHLALTQVLIDTDTTSGTNYVDISTIGLDYMGNGTNSPSGGASGVPSYTMTKYAYWVAPGSACVMVTGTPTMGGTFPIKIKSYARANAFGSYQWAPAPDNTDYRLVVTGTSSVEIMDMAKFNVAQNSPNPFNAQTEINFTSPSVTDVDFKVYNVVGAVVYSEKVKADKGSNVITLKANSFAPGAYMYSLTNGAQTITKRMVVTQ